ncbi:hypothetical protein V8H18_10515 [Lautropia mirabilis]|jgi:hypothetical protein
MEAVKMANLSSRSKAWGERPRLKKGKPSMTCPKKEEYERTACYFND